MDHQAVSVSLGLGGLLDIHLIFLCKQMNRDYWKFDIKNANETKWFEFRDNTTANAIMFSDAFGFAVRFSDLDAYTRKLYYAAKLLESKHAEESHIKQAIVKKMESFELDKSHIIRSVLEHSFCKVVLDHLVVGDKLILEPNLVKSKMDKIIKEWTRKHRVVFELSADWVCQFQPLDYVFDGAFSGVMCSISLNEMSAIVKNFSDEKTVGFFGISNELWKHCDKSVLDMLLVFLNFCLVSELVPGPWRDAWVSMIPKPYE
ncbi:hypothetical protein G9A89_003768 [Geosiphon pyriformis]|nr:hypothetical protein G9A89_003768 [Geosiphon pyriformis]